jgi:tetraprenyl-beta-curcumene synthase
VAGAFAVAAVRYWLGVFPRVCRELRAARRRAQAIPDPELRAVALAALSKRGNIEGAAAFAALTPFRRRAAATRALVAFQLLYNHLDALAEQPSSDPVANARRLHGALLQALDPQGAGDEAGGYLLELLAASRGALTDLPSYDAVAGEARAAAERIVAFQSLSLARDAPGRSDLEAWARAQTPPGSDLSWWEVAAACGSSLPVLALIALAARQEVEPAVVIAMQDAYFPAAAALHSLLDSLVDTEEDAETRQLSLVGCYPSPPLAAERMQILAERALLKARAAAGRGHEVLVASMAASYLHELRRSEPVKRAVAQRVSRGLGPVLRPALVIFALRRA